MNTQRHPADTLASSQTQDQNSASKLTQIDIRGGWTRVYRRLLAAHPTKPKTKPPPYPAQRARRRELELAGKAPRRPAKRRGRPKGHSRWGRPQKWTLIALATLCYGARMVRGAYLGSHAFAPKADCSRSTVLRHLTDLTALGLVELAESGGGWLGGSACGKANCYRVTFLGWQVLRGDVVLVPWLLYQNNAAEESTDSLIHARTRVEETAPQEPWRIPQPRPADAVGPPVQATATATSLLGATAKTKPNPWSKYLSGYVTTEGRTVEAIQTARVTLHAAVDSQDELTRYLQWAADKGKVTS